mmetsp:Transcript_7910/g.13273  ORF Transcript_7910/g.13273 Transcript_7910/m.13273 type:complete len:381 (+) Transcript_7910:1047-2189(+)
MGLSRLLFSSGMEGGIKVWMIPESIPDDKFPQTNGKSHIIGTLGDEAEDEPFFKLAYNSVSNLLLALKSNQKVLVWDCQPLSDLITKATSQEKEGEDQPGESEPQIKLTVPADIKAKTEMTLEIDGEALNAACVCWMPTDNYLCVVGYEKGYLAFFQHNNGSLSRKVKVSEQGEAIIHIIPHQLESKIVFATADCKVQVYDFKLDKVVASFAEEGVVGEDGCAQSLRFTNNDLSLLVGYQSGSVKLFNVSTQQLISTVKKAHVSKYDCGVTDLVSVEDRDLMVFGGVQSMAAEKKEGDAGSKEQAVTAPFFISSGPDGTVKLFELNPYQESVSEAEKKLEAGSPSQALEKDKKERDEEGQGAQEEKKAGKDAAAPHGTED